MAEASKTVEVNLLGRTYRVACDDREREALMQAVAYLDGKMSEIRKAGKVMKHMQKHPLLLDDA